MTGAANTEGGAALSPLEDVHFAQIEVTTRCNFTCGFCAGRHMEQRDISLQTFEEVLRSLPSLQAIELQGEGEPLLHPDFFLMAQKARARGISVYTITNGSLFDRDTVERLLDADLGKILISIESPDPERFAEIRGGMLDKVLRGIRLLIERRNERGLTTPKVGFAVTVMRDTRQEFPAILALYDTLGLDGGIGFQELKAMEVYSRNYAGELQAQLLSEEEVFVVKAQRNASPELQRVVAAARAYPGFYDRLFAGVDLRERKCPWLAQGIYVSAGGNALPCCLSKDEARDTFGRLSSEHLLEVAAEREKMRQELADGSVPKACRGCSLVSIFEKVSPGFGASGAVRLPLVP